MSRRIDVSGKTNLNNERLFTGQDGKMVFTSYKGQKAALLIRNDKLCAVSLFPRVPSKIGSVYICKVKNAVKNLNTYFVEIGGENREICFLSEKDAAHPFLLNRIYDGRILEGDEFPVQVIRDAVKTKPAAVTTLISLANPYFAMSVGQTKTGYSGKLSDEQKETLRQLIRAEEISMPRIRLPLQAKPKNVSPDNTSLGNTFPDDASKGDTVKAVEENLLPAGFIVRTKAADEGISLSEQWTALAEQWENLFRTAEHRTCFSCLLEAPSPWEAAMEQLAFPYEYDRIVTDDPMIYEQLLASGNISADKQISFYDEQQSARLPLTKLYGLESKMETALNRRVWLKSGGYLVIDPTEALTVIDVNSGKYESGKAAEETYGRINREAAEEVARQLRLRNLSGMIVVDFINMKSSEAQKELLEYLRTLVTGDRQRTTVVDMTPLGLVEITRKRSSKPLSEQIERVGKS